MPCGGARPGSGPKQKLSYEQRLFVAFAIQRRKHLLNLCHRKQVLARLMPERRMTELPHVKTLPIPYRKEANAQSELDDEYMNLELPDAILDAADNIKERRKYLDEEPGRRFVRIPRLYAYREKLFQRVAKWASKRFGRPISPRMVETCWDEYRTDFPDDL